MCMHYTSFYPQLLAPSSKNEHLFKGKYNFCDFNVKKVQITLDNFISVRNTSILSPKTMKCRNLPSLFAHFQQVHHWWSISVYSLDQPTPSYWFSCQKIKVIWCSLVILENQLPSDFFTLSLKYTCTPKVIKLNRM